jgi:hypothetical protein
VGQLYPNPVSSTTGVTVFAGPGLSGGGFVPLNGAITLSAAIGGADASRVAYPVSPAADGSFQTFTITGYPAGLTLLYADVYVGGVLQTLGTNYTFPVPGSIFFTTAPASGDRIDVVFSNPPGNRFQYAMTPAPNGVTTSFSFPGDLPSTSYVDVYVNGVLQTPTINYSLNLTAGTWSVVFTTAPLTNDIIETVFAPDELSTRNLYTLTPAADGVTTSFGIGAGSPVNPDLYIDVFVNGLFQSPVTNYNLNLVDGIWTVVFTTAPLLGDAVETVFGSGSAAIPGTIAQVASVDLTGQSAAIAATTVYTVPATGEGLYQVSYVATVTTAASTSCILGGAVGFQIQYTNASDSVVKISSSTYPVVSAINTANNSISGAYYARCKASTNIQYLFDYASTLPGEMVYDLTIRVEFLG